MNHDGVFSQEGKWYVVVGGVLEDSHWPTCDEAKAAMVIERQARDSAAQFFYDHAFYGNSAEFEQDRRNTAKALADMEALARVRGVNFEWPHAEECVVSVWGFEMFRAAVTPFPSNDEHYRRCAQAELMLSLIHQELEIEDRSKPDAL